jgi:tetratricopeptide (TPR) repeat protein
MENYDIAWRMSEELLEELDSSNLYNLYTCITFATPFLERDYMPIVWFRKTYDYLEYIRENISLNLDEPNNNWEDSDDELIESDNSLVEAYGTLGRYFWYEERDDQYALLCYQQEMNLIKSKMIDAKDDMTVTDLGEIYQRMADVYCEVDVVKALDLYGQTIDIFAKHEECYCVELAVCWTRIGCFQNEMCLEYFQRSFNLLLKTTSPDIYDINIDSISECYFYLAKKYADSSLSNHRQMALKWSEQALRLYLMDDYGKPDREVDNYVQLLMAIHTDINC